MALLASGIALAMMAARVMALLALVMVSLAPALVLLPVLPPLALPALVLAGTRAPRLEQKRREPYEASGLVRGWRRQQLPRLQGAVAAAEASPHDGCCVGSRRVVQRQLRRSDLRQGIA